MTKSEREMLKTLREGLLLRARGAKATEEKEIVEEPLEQGGKRKLETTIKHAAPDMEAMKMMYSMLSGEGKAKDGVAMVHMVPRPKDDVEEMEDAAEDGMDDA